MTDKNEPPELCPRPLPPGEYEDSRFKVSSMSWYVLVDGAWHWWDDRDKEWKPAPLGPVFD